LRLDVWGGENSREHLARSHHGLDEEKLWQAVRNELNGGFLVNLRMLGKGEGWGPNIDFDGRGDAEHQIQ
jgi:hypothetical protein